jgi:hypothetical protein
MGLFDLPPSVEASINDEQIQYIRWRSWFSAYKLMLVLAGIAIPVLIYLSQGLAAICIGIISIIGIGIYILLIGDALWNERLRHFIYITDKAQRVKRARSALLLILSASTIWLVICFIIHEPINHALFCILFFAGLYALSIVIPLFEKQK